MEGGLWKWSISLYGSSVRGIWRCKGRLGRRAPLSMGTSMGNLGDSSYSVGLCVEGGSGTGVSPYKSPVGDLERGVRVPGTLKDG